MLGIPPHATIVIMFDTHEGDNLVLWQRKFKVDISTEKVLTKINHCCVCRLPLLKSSLTLTTSPIGLDKAYVIKKFCKLLQDGLAMQANIGLIYVCIDARCAIL